MFVQIALFIASLIISAALQPKTPKPKAAAFEDFDLPTAEDGTPQIVVFGDVWLTDWTVIGIGNYRNEAIVDKVKGLLGTKKVITGYRYFMALHMGLCRSLDDLVEIKISDRLAWSGTLPNNSIIEINQPNLFGGDKSEGGIVGTLKILRGASDQTVLPQLETIYGLVPAYRGVTTFFYDGMICSNSPYPKPWSYRVQRVSKGWDGEVFYPSKAVIWLNDHTIKAMNPVHIIFEAQTNRNWGRGFSSSQLDMISYEEAANQLFNENFGMCLAWRRQDTLTEFLQQILDHIGAAHFIDRTSGLWKLVLIRDNYSANDLQTFDASTGLLEVTEDHNSASDVAANQVVVSYRDPVTNEDRTIRAENLAAIQAYGVITETKSYSGIPTAELAGRIAARDMKAVNSGLKKFKIVLDRRAYQLQPASVFRIYAPEQGILNIVLRAVRVEHDTATNGKITVTAVQDLFGLPATVMIPAQPSQHTQPNHTAMQPTVYQMYQPSYYDLMSNIEDASLVRTGLGSRDHIYSFIAAAPTPLHLYFHLWIAMRQYEDKVPPSYVNLPFSNDSISGAFCPVAYLVDDDLPSQNEPSTIKISGNFNQLSRVQINSAIMLDSEILRLDAIDSVNQTITVSRGCADSVPAAHSIGSMLWFYDDAQSISTRACP